MNIPWYVQVPGKSYISEFMEINRGEDFKMHGRLTHRLDGRLKVMDQMLNRYGNSKASPRPSLTSYGFNDKYFQNHPQNR